MLADTREKKIDTCRASGEKARLPAPCSELAHETPKDPCRFDVLLMNLLLVMLETGAVIRPGTTRAEPDGCPCQDGGRGSSAFWLATGAGRL